MRKIMAFLNSRMLLFVCLSVFFIIGALKINFSHTKEHVFFDSLNTNFEDQKMQSLDSLADNWTGNLIERKLDIYLDDVNKFNNNLYLQIILIAFTLIIMFNQKKENQRENKREENLNEETEIPVLNYRISSIVLSIIIPIVLLYLFLEFGFMLDNLIRERYILWNMLNKIETEKAGLLPNTIFSYKLLLENRTLIDAWFHAFISEKVYVKPSDSGLTCIIVVLWSFVIAANHSCIIAPLFRLNYKWNKKIIWKIVVWFIIIAVMFIIMMAHVGFQTNAGNVNYLQWYAAGATFILIFVMVNIYIKNDNVRNNNDLW